MAYQTYKIELDGSSRLLDPIILLGGIKIEVLSVDNGKIWVNNNVTLDVSDNLDINMSCKALIGTRWKFSIIDKVSHLIVYETKGVIDILGTINLHSLASTHPASGKIDFPGKPNPPGTIDLPETINLPETGNLPGELDIHGIINSHGEVDASGRVNFSGRLSPALRNNTRGRFNHPDRINPTERLNPVVHYNTPGRVDKPGRIDTPEKVKPSKKPCSSGNNQSKKKLRKRCVDVILEHLVDESYKPYCSNTHFLADQNYRLGIHIVGQPSHLSLMAGKKTPIDTLLQPSELQKGYHLVVAVFEKDFELLSGSVQYLYLPYTGDTKLVYFKIHTPKKTGQAKLRINVYHKNHLIQSFLLKAKVSKISSVITGTQVKVGLDFCRTAQFTNLDQLKRRALSLGINQNQDRTHTLMIKGKNKTTEHYKLLENQVKTSLKIFRNLMEQATWADDGISPRFSVKNGQQPVLEFEKYIRNLAKFGNELFQMIFQGASEQMRGQIKSLREKTDECIQIIRHDPNFSFPWTIVYDYTVPDVATPIPICMGEPLPISTGISEPKPPRGITWGCPHNPNRAVICIDGFWGIRHQIEQLISSNGKVDGVCSINKTVNPGNIWLATNLNKDPSAESLKEILNKILEGNCVEYTSESSLYDFWDKNKRPAVLIVLGHMENNNRISLIPGAIETESDQWLSPRTIIDYFLQYKSWDQPNPMILLMACESARIQLSDLNNLVKAFQSVGASAIIGTECTVFSSLAADFAREIILKLWNGKTTLGKAIQSFNRETLQKHIPLPFVFNCVGNLDLTLNLTKRA